MNNTQTNNDVGKAHAKAERGEYGDGLGLNLPMSEQIEIAMRSSLEDIKNQCQFVIQNSTNHDLVKFATLILNKAS